MLRRECGAVDTLARELTLRGHKAVSDLKDKKESQGTCWKEGPGLGTPPGPGPRSQKRTVPHTRTSYRGQRREAGPAPAADHAEVRKAW